jgi:PEP-CTERM motif
VGAVHAVEATLTFQGTAYGSSKSKHEQEKVQTLFEHEQKSYKREHYDVSNFNGYGWKPDYEHDYCPPIPVPEPQTYALLLAGLGVMTVFARRRKVLVK